MLDANADRDPVMRPFDRKRCSRLKRIETHRADEAKGMLDTLKHSRGCDSAYNIRDARGSNGSRRIEDVLEAPKDRDSTRPVPTIEM